MAKVKVSGKTKVSVKKRPRRYIGGRGDGAFISTKILTTVKKSKEKSNEKP